MWFFYSVVRDADFFVFLPLAVVLVSVSVVCLWRWDLPVLVFWPFLAGLVVRSVVGLLAFPCFVIGLLAFPLCGGAPTFLCLPQRKVGKRKRLKPPAHKRVPRTATVVVHLESVPPHTPRR